MFPSDVGKSGEGEMPFTHVLLVKAIAILAVALTCPPLNGSTSGSRIQGGRTLGRAIVATWKARAGGSDHPQAACAVSNSGKATAQTAREAVDPGRHFP